jgi:signal transduction histidine kinase
LVADIAAEASGLISAAGQRLKIDCDHVAEVVLKVDAGRLRHVFMNLLTNASKYSPPGNVIELGATHEGEGFVRFGVKDYGAGIPPEAVAHVFERFYRAPGQTKTGAGVGLAIAREVVIAHGGTISCSSELGKGTEFNFILPV